MSHDPVPSLAGERERLEALLASGRPAEVVESCSRLPERDAALENLLGRALVATGDLAGAERAFRAARAADPGDPRFASNLGNVLRSQGNLEGAVALYRESLAGRPDAPRVLSNLGVTLNDLGRHREARVVLERAISLEPSLVSAIIALSRALLGLDEAEPSIALLERALTGLPESPLLAAELGSRLLDRDRLEEASSWLERAALAAPNDGGIAAALGACLRRRGLYARAIATLERALAVAPDLAQAHLSLGQCLREVGRSHEAVEELAFAERAMGFESGVGSAKLCAMLFDEQASAPSIREAHAAWGARVAARRRGARAPAPRRARRRPLRVGYLSGHFRTHVIMNFLLGLFGAHDPAAVELHLLSCGSVHDVVSAELARRFSFHDLHAHDEAAFADAVVALDLDVLVDLDGHTGNTGDSRLLALADRLATVQATYLGYPSTTGLATIDYRISDAMTDPEGAEIEFTETLHRLPRIVWSYAPFGSPSPRPRAPSDEVVFGCFSRLEKIGESTLATFRRILLARPDARLVLKSRVYSDEGIAARVRAALGSDVARRVDLRPWVGTLTEHYQSYAEIDVVLDTFPYNGTTTICDALWMGVPVVSRSGDTSASRVGRSLLGAVDLGAWVAPSFDEYVDRAVALSRDRELRARLHAELPSRVRSGPLGDPVGLARALEAAYGVMLEEALAKRELAEEPETA